MKSLTKKRKNDLLLILGVLLLALVCIGVLYFTRQTGAAVSVTQNGKVTAIYPLAIDREIVIPDENGGSNTMVIKDGAAKMIDADCPDLLCVHQKSIRYHGETIVCLPHKLVLKVESSDGSDAPDIDIVT